MVLEDDGGYMRRSEHRRCGSATTEYISRTGTFGGRPLCLRPNIDLARQIRPGPTARWVDNPENHNGIQ